MEKKTRKPGYLTLGVVMIGILSVLIIYMAMIFLGVVQISGYHLVVTTESANKMYDGEPITADGWEIIEGELRAGHTVEAKVLGMQTEVGVSDNNISLTIYDSEGADVTGKYNIEYRLGQLAINGKMLEFSSGSASKEYDGEALTNSECTFLGGELLEGHALTYYATGSITTVGHEENTIEVTVIDTATGADVTNYYFLEMSTGTLTVNARKLMLSGSVAELLAGSKSPVEYKGIFSAGTLDDGHRVMCRSIASSGGYDAMHVYVLDADGNDVTHLYDVTVAGGDLSVKNPESLFSKNLDDYDKSRLAALGAAAAMAGLDTPVYKVLAEKTGVVYLRASSYGDYDGNDWTDGPQYVGVSPFTFATDSLQNGGALSSAVQVTPLFDGIPLSMPYYYVNGDYVYGASSNDVTVSEEEVTVKNQTYNYVYIPYEYGNTIKYYKTTMTAQEQQYYAFVLENYLGVNADTKQKLLEIAAENGIYANDADIINKVVEYIRTAATYNLSFAPFPDDVDKVIYFLTEAKEGICQHYAAAATLMFRSLGIPARYVTGFMAETVAGQEVVVTAKQCHAWVEVYIEGFGWVQLEVTGSDGSDGTPIEDPSGLNGSDAMGDIPSDMISGGEVVVAEITANKGTHYLRSESFGDFDGKNWREAKVISRSSLQGLIDADISPYTVNLLGLEALATISKQDMTVTMLAENYPYMLPYYASTFTFMESNDCYVVGPELGVSYTIKYYVFDYLKSSAPVPTRYTIIENAYRQMVYSEYTAVSEEYRRYFSSLGISASDADVIAKVRDYIKNAAEFSTKFDTAPDGEDGVFYFLQTSKKGISRHFATAATLMYRSLGIPARYTTGYCVTSDGTRKMTVTTLDAKAWVEVYIDGEGWVMVDVTPAAKTPVNNNITINIPTYAASKTYDGTPLTSDKILWDLFESENKEWTYDAATGICTNESRGCWFDTSTVTATASRTTVGSSSYSVSGVRVKNNDGSSFAYSVTLKTTNKITVNPIELVLTGHGKDISDSNEKYYHKYTLEGALVDGHKIEVVFTYNKDNPVPEMEMVENTIKEVIITDAAGNNVTTSIYKITWGSHGGLIN